ncbi:MAG: hypothetical protein FJ125_10155, partial [Deltaproteobacteria bacterium]|nr:hypothetical protein [Deltaproteobacteria bacterium]
MVQSGAEGGTAAAGGPARAEQELLASLPDWDALAGPGLAGWWAERLDRLARLIPDEPLLASCCSIELAGEGAAGEGAAGEGA